MNPNLETIKTITEILEKALTAFGIFVGAAWAYYKYIRGRTFRHRLEVNISGTYAHGCSNMVLTIELKNIGASDIPLRQEGTAAIVEMLDVTQPLMGKDVPGAENSVVVVEILQDHEWIESSETIREQHFVHLPSSDPKALRLKLRVVSQGRTFSKRTAWACTSIATPQSHYQTEPTKGPDK